MKDNFLKTCPQVILVNLTIAIKNFNAILPGYTPPPIPSYYYNVRERQQTKKNKKVIKIQLTYSYNKIMIRIIKMEVDYQVLPTIFILFSILVYNHDLY